MFKFFENHVWKISIACLAASASFATVFFVAPLTVAASIVVESIAGLFAVAGLISVGAGLDRVGNQTTLRQEIDAIQRGIHIQNENNSQSIMNAINELQQRVKQNELDLLTLDKKNKDTQDQLSIDRTHNEQAIKTCFRQAQDIKFFQKSNMPAANDNKITESNLPTRGTRR